MWIYALVDGASNLPTRIDKSYNAHISFWSRTNHKRPMSVTGKLLLFSVLSSVYSARILGIFPTPSISHQAVFQPIWRELSLQGHQVTVITPNPLKDRHLTNLTEVDASFLYEHVGTVTSTLKVKKDHWYLWKRILSSQGKTADNLLSHPAVVTLIKDKNIRFDLIIAEFLFPFMTPLAVKYGCPFIGVLPYLHLP